MKKKDAHRPCTGERAGAVLFSQWQELCRLRLHVLERGDTDSIHDLRVATRRLRAMTGLFEPFLVGVTAGNISKEIRRVTRRLGRVRNVDEAAIYFGALPAPLPALTGTLVTLREQEMKAVAALLKKFPLHGLDRELREAVETLAGMAHDDPALPVYFSETSIQRYQAVYDLLPPAAVPENIQERHDLRIAIKKWRYLLETLGLVCQRDYSAALATLKEYQTLLGSLNDLAEFGVLCQGLEIPADEKAAAATFLAADTERYLTCFLDTASTRPLHYTFIP